MRVYKKKRDTKRRVSVCLAPSVFISPSPVSRCRNELALRLARFAPRAGVRFFFPSRARVTRIDTRVSASEFYSNTAREPQQQHARACTADMKIIMYMRGGGAGVCYLSGVVDRWTGGTAHVHGSRLLTGPFISCLFIYYYINVLMLPDIRFYVLLNILSRFKTC